MTFDPGYTATFAQPVPANVMNDSEGARFWARWRGRKGSRLRRCRSSRNTTSRARRRRRAPALTIYRRRTGITRDADQDYLIGSVAEFAVEIGVQGTKAGDVMRALETYVKAVDAIIRSATEDEMLANFPDERPQVIWDVTEHVYGADVPEGETHTRAAALTLVFQSVEN
jgi:hypothetical protein